MKSFLLLGLLSFALASLAAAQTAPATFSGFIGYRSSRVQDGDSGHMIYVYNGTTRTQIYLEYKTTSNFYRGPADPVPYSYRRIDATHGVISSSDIADQTLTFTSPTHATWDPLPPVGALPPRDGMEFVPIQIGEGMVNASVRVAVNPGKSALVGFVIVGSRDRWVLIRSVGPGLAHYGVPGTLADPRISVTNPYGFVVASAGSWRTSGVPQDALAGVTNLLGAFPLETKSDDAVLFVLLHPGVYLAATSSTSGTGSGEVLTEVYIMP